MNGLWTAEFGSSNGGFGGGVVVFEEGGRLFGGDGTYFYIGQYSLTGTTFRATLISSPFIDGAESVFKTVGRDLTLELVGTVTEGNKAVAQGHLKDAPAARFAVKLTKRS
jgi:hypothetical protein